MRDPAGIRPAYYYQDDEVIVVASERPVIQTVFNVPFETINEIEPGTAILMKKDGTLTVSRILEATERKSCSFERIYFSRGSDAEIYQERKELGRLIMPDVLKAIDFDTNNSVFSFIPNTAETSFYGMLDAAQNELNKQKNRAIFKDKENLTEERLEQIQAYKIRTEKIAIKDVKLRTFIADDSSRDDLVAHVYDVTYGVVQPDDNLVIIDDSIVRGTTLRKSILKMLDRLNPKQIVVVSSAPQIRYPDCYGIDMARMEDLIAFQAALELHKDQGTIDIVEKVYQKCKQQVALIDTEVINHVKELYAPFTDEQISEKIAEIISDQSINAKVNRIFQTVDNLHKACPKNLGDWYFTGNYPTPGGNRVVNKAFINFYEGNSERAY
jgi:amidophosphoribosyltransferase